MGIAVAASASSPSAPVAHPPCAINWDSDSSARSVGSACSASVTSSAEVRITLVGDGKKCLGGKCCQLNGGCSWQATAIAGLLALVLIVAVALAIALPIAILQERRGDLNQAVQVRGAGAAVKPVPTNFSIRGTLQVAPSQTSVTAKAAIAVLCTAAASTAMSGDAIQSALTSTVRSFGVEGVTVAVADTQCTKGAELAFNVQLHCASADPELAAAVAQTLTGPAGVAAALAQLKRTTVGIFGEAGSVLLTQLKLEAVAVGSGSPSGSSASSAGAGGAALAAVASGGARDVGSGNVGSTSNAAAQSASVADVVSVAGSGSGGMAGTAGATEQAAQQTEAANSGQGGAAAVAAG